jgi:type I restriction enzyme, S subunit
MGHHREPLYLGPMIVLARIGANAGALRYSNEPAWINNNASALIPDLAVNPRWLYYKLLSMSLDQYRAGTSQPFIALDALMSATVDIPDRNTQNLIADALSALDDKIELNRRMNTTLEAMARALFQSWFVDFDPVHAKAEGRQPVGMGAETTALFPDSFEDSVLGPIPKGWEVTSLGNMIGLLNGFAFKSQDWMECGVPVVKIGSVKPGYIDLDEGSFVSEEVAYEASRFALQVGDILIGMTGYVGEVGIMYDLDVSPLLNQRVGKFEFNQKNGWTREVCYPLLRHPRFKKFVVDRSVGSAQANVSSSAILEFPVVHPAEQLVRAFDEVITPLVRKLIANYQEIDQCRRNRDTLLPKLLSGELRIGDVAA